MAHQQQGYGYGPMPPYPPPAPKKSHGCLYAILGAVAVVIIIVIIIVVVIANSGPKNVTSQSKPEAGKSASTSSGLQQLKIGQPAVISDNGAKADVEVTSVNLTTQPPSSSGQAPQNGDYAIVSVSVSNVTGGSFDANPLDFYVVVNGAHYDMTSGNASSALDNEWSAATLNPGEHITGQEAFDVPAGHG